MNELSNVIRLIKNMSDKDKNRLLECLYCPFYEECRNTVDHPIDNGDGTCKTKELYINKIKELDIHD